MKLQIIVVLAVVLSVLAVFLHHNYETNKLTKQQRKKLEESMDGR